MKRKKSLTIQKRKTREAFMFLAPWLIGTCLFFILAVFSSIKLSFSEIAQIKGFAMKWVGLENYKHIFIWDINFVPILLTVVKDTLLNTPITLVFSLVIAILINRPVFGRGFFRTAFFIPVLLGSGYIMKQLLGISVTGGVGVGIVIPGGVESMLGPVISSVVQSFLDRITIVLWKSGVQIILFLAGLQGISTSYYEAARCDGATEWEMFWKITLPMISPVILLNFIYTMVSYFSSSDNALVEYILNQVFKNTQFGTGAAMGWVYFLFTFLLCAVVFVIMQRRVVNVGERE
ncbi:MAG: sugar ABC transporter permease [Lachnospiraceae bacterium]|nr:sugar ABC transporter permease [Lachnospiraceae bacterium]